MKEKPMTTKSVPTLFLTAGLSLLSCGVLAQGLLPKPQSFTARKGAFDVNAAAFKVVNEAGDDARNIYSAACFAKASDNAGCVVRFVRLENASSTEAYRLHITSDTLLVSAASADAFRYAWQTVEQLKNKKGAVPACDIDDAPAYRWRSLMIDVSRHFQPISFLKKQIDVMSQYKFNRLHLHLTDAAGWRMEIKRYPRLTNLAAWRPERTWKEWGKNGSKYAKEGTEGAYGGYYTQEQLRDLVSYAAERGITIVPEIEMPGHSAEVLTAYPELSCTHEPYKQMDFCPGSVATYDFLENVLKEVMDVFPSKYIHVGGDEADKASWPSCPLCQEKMRELGCDKDGLQAHLIAHFGKFLTEHGRQLVGWDEVIAGNLAKNTTVMVWRGLEKAHEAIEHGYDVVLSPGAYCYLDAYQDAPDSQPEAIGGFLPLEKVYSYIPGEDLPEAERRRITGVQANLWTEYIPTPEHAEYMLYPRALAIAEIGWNGTEKKDYPEFRQRALKQIEHLRRQGVNTFDLAHERGERPESKKPIKHKALGCKVIFNHRYSDKYKAQGDQTLVDGQRGGWTYGDQKWQGYINGDYCLDVTLDLGKRQSIKSVSAVFMQAYGAWVFFPEEFKVSVSDDGKNFTEVYTTTSEVNRDIQSGFRTLEWKGAKQTRYIRVQGKTTMDGGWLFTDEIVVK